MSFKKIRNMKVYEQSGYRYKSTPTIMLKGQWLNELGFGYGTQICVECSGGKLVITRADEIETLFAEIGTEPVMCVAEGTTEYGEYLMRLRQYLQKTQYLMVLRLILYLPVLL